MNPWDDETAAALFATVKAEPTNGLAKAVLADRFEELDRPHLAHAFRWCAKHGKHPSVSEKGRSIRWGRANKGEILTMNIGESYLPAMVFDLIPRGRSGRGRYKSETAAYCAVADVFAAIHDAIAV